MTGVETPPAPPADGDPARDAAADGGSFVVDGAYVRDQVVQAMLTFLAPLTGDYGPRARRRAAIERARERRARRRRG